MKKKALSRSTLQKHLRRGEAAYSKLLAEAGDLHDRLNRAIEEQEQLCEDLASARRDLGVVGAENKYLLSQIHAAASQCRSDVLIEKAPFLALEQVARRMERSDTLTAVSTARGCLHAIASPGNWALIPVASRNDAAATIVVWKLHGERDPWFWAETILKHLFGEEVGDGT